MSCKEILKRLVVDCPKNMVECDSFNHKKKDRHGYMDVCPVMERYEKSLEEAQRYLLDNKGDDEANIKAAHDWIRSALRLPESAPYRFDFYAQEIEKLNR